MLTAIEYEHIKQAEKLEGKSMWFMSPKQLTDNGLDEIWVKLVEQAADEEQETNYDY